MQPAFNQIILFEHPNFTGKTLVIDLNMYTPHAVHAFSGTSIQDRASAVRWHLPANRVVTLCDNNSRPSLPDLSGLGRTVDLIGDGAVRSQNLDHVDTSDCLSAFFWRDVDLSRGRVTFYKDSEFRNFRQTIFIAEWTANKVHSISNWAMQDKMSSVRWVDLDPRVVVELYDTASGGGSSYRNIIRRAGPGQVEEIKSLSAVGMQDKVSSFKIVEKLPVIEEIEKIEFDRRQHPRKSVTLDSKGSVVGTQSPSIYTASVATSWNESSSVTVEQSHTTGGQFSYQYASGDGSFGKHTFSITLSYSYTNARSDTQSQSHDLTITHNESYPIPPNHSWKFKYILRYDQIDVDFTTQATRWYDMPLSGTVMDTTKVPNQTLYRRVETIKGTLKGAFSFDTQSSFVATPL